MGFEGPRACGAGGASSPAAARVLPIERHAAALPRPCSAAGGAEACANQAIQPRSQVQMYRPGVGCIWGQGTSLSFIPLGHSLLHSFTHPRAHSFI